MQSVNASTTPAFPELWEAGYRSLVPITAASGTPSPLGAYADRPRDMGKGPGVVNQRGEWVGVPWLSEAFRATPERLAEWAAMGAGAGIRVGVPDERGDRVVAVDVDVLAPHLSERVVDLAFEHLGTAPIRTGRAPKRLLVYRTRERLRNGKVLLDDGVTASPAHAQVDVMVSGKQFVAYGIHPGTGQPYTWEDFDVLGELAPITQTQVDAFLAAVKAEMPAARLEAEAAADRATVDQRSLEGDPERVAEAMRSLPNGPEFDTWEAYRNVGIALKAAMPGDPDEAEHLWMDWCDRWHAGRGTPGEARRHWASFKPPFALGAGYLYARAQEAGSYSLAQAHFDPLPEPTPEEIAVEAARAAEEKAKSVIDWIDVSQAWTGKVPPPREYLVDGMLPMGETALIFGDGGTGKSLIAQILGTILAAGLGEFFGLKCRGPCRVMLFLCEDHEDELHRRQVDIMTALGIEWSALGGRLRISSRKFMDNTLMGFEAKSGLAKVTKLYGAFRDDVAAFKPDWCAVDTAADTYAGNENDRQQVRTFIQTGMGGLILAGAGAVAVLAHPSRAGMSTGTGDSGSTGWSNSVRARLYLQHVEGDSALRTLTVMKSNYGSKGDVFLLRWRAGCFDLVNATVTNKESLANPDTFPDATGANDTAVVDALLANPGIVLSPNRNSQNHAPKVLKREPGSPVALLQVQEIEGAINRLLASGRIRWGEVGRDAARRPQKGLIVSGDAPAERSIFD